MSGAKGLRGACAALAMSGLSACATSGGGGDDSSLGPASTTVKGQAPRASGPAIDPASLIGAAGADLSKLFGPASLVRRERNAEVWQYAGEACVLLFYLYDQTADGFRVTHFEALGTEAGGSEVPKEPCLSAQAAAAAAERKAAPSPGPVSAYGQPHLL